MTAEPFTLAAGRIGRTALVVTDLDESVDFYRDVVGLEVLSRNTTRATLGVDGTSLLVLERDEAAPPRESEQAGLFHNAFKVPSEVGLGAAYDRITDRWSLDGASDHHVSKALYVRDPEGNGVEIYCDRPKSEWPRSSDGSVEIGTVPLEIDAITVQSDGASRVPEGTTVGHVHLEATSLTDARAFYVDLLGLGVQTELEDALFVAAGDYHHHLGVNTWYGRTEPAGERGLAWFELVVPNESILETVRPRLTDADVAVADRDEFLEITAPDAVSLRLRGE